MSRNYDVRQDVWAQQDRDAEKRVNKIKDRLAIRQLHTDVVNQYYVKELRHKLIECLTLADNKNEPHFKWYNELYLIVEKLLLTGATLPSLTKLTCLEVLEVRRNMMKNFAKCVGPQQDLYQIRDNLLDIAEQEIRSYAAEYFNFCDENSY